MTDGHFSPQVGNTGIGPGKFEKRRGTQYKQPRDLNNRARNILLLLLSS